MVINVSESDDQGMVSGELHNAEVAELKADVISLEERVAQESTRARQLEADAEVVAACHAAAAAESTAALQTAEAAQASAEAQLAESQIALNQVSTRPPHCAPNTT